MISRLSSLIIPLLLIQVSFRRIFSKKQTLSKKLLRRSPSYLNQYHQGCKEKQR